MTGGGCGCELNRIEQMIRHIYWESETRGVVIGVSGGIDSSVAAAVCARALGPGSVLALSLPTGVSDPADLEDAAELCRLLGCEHRVVSIEPVLDSYRRLPGFDPGPVLLGNVMARTRMTVLYHVANRDGRLVCGTSNRTEYLLGYSTKWGDSAADVQPLLHLYKRDVCRLGRELGLPQRIIEKPPTAGLWPGQRDEDELGLTYAEIDGALEELESGGWTARTPVEEQVLARVRAAGHKRRAPISLFGDSPGF
ncbi:MAG: NAD(+) synthase [Methanospirillum sp.]|nr:NAD(+) synthase [Methanospirillum sp.]